MRRKQDKLTLRDLVLTCYLQEVSRGHSKLRYEPDKIGEASQQTKDRMLELGKNITRTYQSEKKKKGKPKHVRELLTGG